MSLATRCTSCGTIFRVVQDQLKVSEGWVRCGRCQHVFNALQCLFDLDRDAPPPWPAAGDFDRTQPVTRTSARPSSKAVQSSDAPTVAGEGFARTAVSAADEDAPFSTQPLLRTQSRDVGATDAKSTVAQPTAFTGGEAEDDASSESGFADARFDPDLLDPEEGGATAVAPSVHRMPSDAVAMVAAVAPLSQTQAEPAALRPDSPPLPQLVDEPPRFVLDAERAERWQSPPMRAALGSLAVLLAVLLALQFALHFRAGTAARWPASQGVLADVCEWAVCGPAAPPDLEALSVSSTGLVRGDVPGVYRLVITLNNRALTPVLVPAVELSLTDAQGALISRKTLLPQDLTSQPGVPAKAELTLQALLDTGAHRVVGYSVEIFYP